MACGHIVDISGSIRATFTNESMVSLVLRQYMRDENVLLIQIEKQNVKILEK